MFTFQTGLFSPEEQYSTEPRPKRARIGVACNVCKSKKTKCDGARPVCGPCQSKRGRSVDCTYREIDEVAPRLDTRPFPDPKSGDLPRDRPSLAPQEDSLNTKSTVAGKGEARPSSNTQPEASFFGASSGAHIWQALRGEEDSRRVPADKTDVQGRRISTPRNKLPRLNRISNEHASALDFAIPPRKTADHLFSLYWDYVDNAYPWLDRSFFESAYESLWESEGIIPMNQQAFHCLLNLMFASSCVASQGQFNWTTYQSSSIFFNRARTMMSYDLMQIYSFEVIQILLLTAVYLQHEKEPQQCLQSISSAIHIAQELKLHLPGTAESMEDPRERDLARQVWNGCMIMDRISSMTFGRALIIPQTVAKHGLHSWDSSSMTASNNSSEGRNLPSRLSFYISFCRLHYIIGEVMENFYFNSTGGRKVDESSRWIQGYELEACSDLTHDKLTSLLQVESSLKKWANDLHPFFRMPEKTQDQTPTKHVMREANVLRARYLSVRLLLFRPLLASFLQPKPKDNQNKSLYDDGDDLMSHILTQCQINCTKAAAEMIEFIVANLPERTQSHILPSHWYTVSYIYMAVTILLAVRTTSAVIRHFSTSRLSSLCEQARGVLKKYEHHEILRTRCREALNMIEKNIGEDWPTPESPLMQDPSGNIDHETMVTREDSPPVEGPSFVDKMALIDEYHFDWNEWPPFFAQLEGT